LFFSRVCSVPKKGLLTLATSIERPSGESFSAPSPRPSSDARSVLDVPSGPVTESSLPLRVTETLGGTSMDATLSRAGAAARREDDEAADAAAAKEEAALRLAEAAAAAAAAATIDIFFLLRLLRFCAPGKKIKPPNSKNEENEKRKTHALSFNQRLSLLPRPRIQRMLSPPAACSGSFRSVRACPLARSGTSAAAEKQQQQAALPLCRLRSLKTMPPNKPTAAGASAANAAAAASNGGPPSAEGGSKKSQDDHTAADYYFDSYSHFGKKRGREREKG
jgi:hypothetical protein